MTSPSRIVITGAGAVCGAGLTLENIWHAIEAGKSAVGPLSQWDASRWPVGVAAEVRNIRNDTLVPDRKLHKFLSRTDMFGLYATNVAMRASGLLAYREKLEPQAAAVFNDRSAVFVGSGGGAYQSNYDFFPLLDMAAGDLQVFGRELNSTVNPMWLLTHLPNNVLCYIGIRYGFKGTNACITNQCVGGAVALGEAAEALLSGEAERAVAAGHDAPIEPETVLHYNRLGLLAEDELRSFDERRSGTVFGEGAAAVVLEKETDAQARGASILGEFLGWGCTTEGTGLLEIRPDGDGMKRAIEAALLSGGVAPDQVGMIVAHGNGTRGSDASEVAAIRQVFGERIPPVTAFKWAVGHLIAASGILDVVLALLALRHRSVPGIATLNCLDPSLAPLPVSRAEQKPTSDIALVLCRGFGAMNLAMLVRCAGSNGGA